VTSAESADLVTRGDVLTTIAALEAWQLQVELLAAVRS
jgi:hypothetical protein